MTEIKISNQSFIFMTHLTVGQFYKKSNGINSVRIHFVQSVVFQRYFIIIDLNKIHNGTPTRRSLGVNKD